MCVYVYVPVTAGGRFLKKEEHVVKKINTHRMQVIIQMPDLKDGRKSLTFPELIWQFPHFLKPDFQTDFPSARHYENRCDAKVTVHKVSTERIA